MPDFRSRLEQTLKQDLNGVEFPFIFLDPEFCWHDGFSWWEKKLRSVIKIIAAEKFNDKYLDALRNMSKRLASLELVPYHSSSFNAHRLINDLPSALAAKRFAKKLLTKTENKIDRTVIVTRQVASWELPRGHRNLICYEGGQTRGASLGPDSPGGKGILRQYGIKRR